MDFLPFYTNTYIRQVNAYRVSATIASAVGSTAVANEFIDKTRSGGWFLHLSAVVENALGRQAGGSSE